MTKFYLKNGEEIKVGDAILVAKNRINCPTKIEVTDKVLAQLIDSGYVMEKKHNIELYIKKLASRFNISEEDTHNICSILSFVSPNTLFSLLLKEVALEFDKKYIGHIKFLDNIYIVNMVDGNIHSISTKNVINFKNFAAFRTREDAMIACEILRPLMKDMF